MKKFMKGAAAGMLIFSMLFSTGCSRLQANSEPPVKIAVLSKSSSTYWDAVWEACDHAREELNVEITEYHPEKTGLEYQMPMLEQAVNSDVKAIVLAAVDPEEENDLLAKASQNGKIIITYDSDVNYSGRACYVGTENQVAAKKAASMSVEVYDAHKIGIIYHEEGGTAYIRRDNFIDKINEVNGSNAPALPDGAGSKQNNSEPVFDEEGNIIEQPPTEPPTTTPAKDVHVVKSLLGESDIDVSKAQAIDLIKNEGVDLIYATNQKGGQGACEAVEELLNDGTIANVGDVKIICFDYFTAADGHPKDATYYIQNDILNAVFLQNPYNMAYIGIKYARDLSNGEKIDPSLDTGAVLLTKNNIDAPAIQFLIQQSYPRK